MPVEGRDTHAFRRTPRASRAARRPRPHGGDRQPCRRRRTLATPRLTWKKGSWPRLLGAPCRTPKLRNKTRRRPALILPDRGARPGMAELLDNPALSHPASPGGRGDAPARLTRKIGALGVGAGAG